MDANSGEPWSDLIVSQPKLIRGDAMSHIGPLKGSHTHGHRIKICRRVGNLSYCLSLTLTALFRGFGLSVIRRPSGCVARVITRACDVTYRYEMARSAVPRAANSIK